MHILMIVPTYNPLDLPHGGNFYHEHALAAQSQGIQVGIVGAELRGLRSLRLGRLSHYRYRLERFERDGIQVWKCLGWAIPKSPKWSRALWVRIAVRLAHHYVMVSGKPDLIHAQRAGLAGSTARELAYKLGIPYVVTEHWSGFARGVARRSEIVQARKAYGDASGVSTVSRALARTISPYAGTQPIEVVPNAIRVEHFSLGQRIDRDFYRFLIVCNLESNKAVDVAIRAFRQQFGGQPGVLLEIGGDGPERDRLGRLVAELGIDDQVHFLGRLSQDGVRAAMHRADCFVLSSRFETFGVVVIEAMATGLPVVATASGGPGVIVNMQTGRVVPVDDAKALGAAMLSIYCDRRYWRAAGPDIRAHVERCYSTAAVGRRLLDFYNDALDRFHEVGQGRGASAPRRGLQR